MAWRYACNIPTYITGKDENGEPVVLYRVNVFFQQNSPDGGGNVSTNGASGTDSAPFFVLRRYSQFRHLHDQLKAAFPSAMSGRGMAPPPKHPLVLGDKRDALERRRGELERWLWRLVATAEVARGPQLKAFLELDKALARAQQQQRQKLEQQRRLLLDGGLPSPSLPPAGPDFLRGGSSSTVPSESGYGGRQQRHLASYPGGGGGASVMGDDSASDASGPSAVPAAPGGGVALDPRAAASGRGDPRVGSAGADGGAGVAQAARLGIHLQSRADVRRLVDVLVQKLEAACSETAAAVSEASMLRDANRAMAERLGDLELERGSQGPAADEVRAQLVESEAARALLEQRVAQLEETLASRSAAQAQQVSQLQSQLAEARADNGELLQRLQEWDVGSSNAAIAEAQQRADEQQRQLDEQQQRADELRRQLDEQRSHAEAETQRAEVLMQQVESERVRADELQRRLDEEQLAAERRGGAEEQELQGRLQQLGRELEERSGQVAELQGRLQDQEQQLANERRRREQAEAAAVPPPPPPPPPQPQHQALLDKARADNALLAQEVQRLRAAAVSEREAHKAALATHSQASAHLAAKVRELEAQLAAAAAATAAAAAAPPSAQGQAQDLLLL